MATPIVAHRPAHDGRPKREELDPLDPAARRHAQMGPPPGVAGEAVHQVYLTKSLDAPTAVATRTRVASLEELLPELVRRIAWSNERGRGTARIEIGHGALAGSVLTVHAGAGALRVHLAASPGSDVAGWRERIEARLRARGLEVAEIEVA